MSILKWCGALSHSARNPEKEHQKPGKSLMAARDWKTNVGWTGRREETWAMFSSDFKVNFLIFGTSVTVAHCCGPFSSDYWMSLHCDSVHQCMANKHARYIVVELVELVTPTQEMMWASKCVERPPQHAGVWYQFRLFEISAHVPLFLSVRSNCTRKKQLLLQAVLGGLQHPLLARGCSHKTTLIYQMYWFLFYLLKMYISYSLTIAVFLFYFIFYVSPLWCAEWNKSKQNTG